MKHRLLLIAPLFFGFALAAQAQDFAFSQFYATPQYLNPALKVSEGKYRAAVNYRTNSNTDLFPYNLMQASFHAPVKYLDHKLLGNVGGAVFNESFGSDGEFASRGAMLQASYFLRITHNQMISFGLQSGFVQKNIDLSQLRWGSQFDPTEQGPNTDINPSLPDGTSDNVLYPTINSGIVWNYEPDLALGHFGAFSGFSVYNINNPRQSFVGERESRLPLRYTFNGGLEIGITDRVSFLPNYLVMAQNAEWQINAGTYLSYQLPASDKNQEPARLMIGGWHRVGDAFIFSLGARYQDFTLGLSYDQTVSDFKFQGRGAATLEFSLSYQFGEKVEHKKIPYPLL